MTPLCIKSKKIKFGGKIYHETLLVSKEIKISSRAKLINLLWWAVQGHHWHLVGASWGRSLWHLQRLQREKQEQRENLDPTGSFRGSLARRNGLTLLWMHLEAKELQRTLKMLSGYRALENPSGDAWGLAKISQAQFTVPKFQRKSRHMKYFFNSTFFSHSYGSFFKLGFCHLSL